MLCLNLQKPFLTRFSRKKTLKSILKLSISAPTPSIPFLTGELPIEGKIHKDVFSLFFITWSNSDTKIYHIVKYLLENTSENSRTWSAHIKHLSRRYGLEDSLSCLSRDPPPKSEIKETVCIRITSYFETMLRKSAAQNNQMKYLNVSTIGLRGRHQPALSNQITTLEVTLSRPHIKLLAGNYLAYNMKSEHRCRICTSSNDETVSHVISTCQGLAVEREILFLQYEEQKIKSDSMIFLQTKTCYVNLSWIQQVLTCLCRSV